MGRIRISTRSLSFRLVQFECAHRLSSATIDRPGGRDIRSPSYSTFHVIGFICRFFFAITQRVFQVSAAAAPQSRASGLLDPPPLPHPCRVSTIIQTYSSSSRAAVRCRPTATFPFYFLDCVSLSVCMLSSPVPGSSNRHSPFSIWTSSTLSTNLPSSERYKPSLLTGTASNGWKVKRVSQK